MGYRRHFGEYEVAIFSAGEREHPPAHVHVYKKQGREEVVEAKFRLCLNAARNTPLHDESQVLFYLAEPTPGKAVLDMDDRLKHPRMVGKDLEGAQKLVDQHFADLALEWMSQHQGRGTALDFQKMG